MPWLTPLIPDDPQALAALDWLLHVMHLAVIIFVMTGWMLRRLRRLHLAVLAVVWFSWLALGLYVGNLGYCLLTDWQWQVKAALGEVYLPPSYPEYLYWRLTGGDIADRLMAFVAAAVLIGCTLVSLWLNLRRRGI